MLLDSKGNPTLIFLSAVKPIYPPISPPIIKYLSMNEATEYLGSKKHLNFQLIKEGCKIMNIPFIGYGTIFCSKGTVEDEELAFLSKELNKELKSNYHYIVVYDKLDKQHKTLSYYSILAIQSSNILDLKKAFKIHALKAFL